MKWIRENLGYSADKFAELLGVEVERYKKAEMQDCKIPRAFEVKVNNIVDDSCGRKRRMK